MAAVLSPKRQVVTLDDFMTGLLAGLAKRNKRLFSLRETFYDAAMKSYRELKRWSEENGAEVQFRVAPNPYHGGAPAVRDGITEAVQRDLVSLDNPTYLRMRIKITPGIADRYLEELPGGTELYDRLTDTFLDAYSTST